MPQFGSYPLVPAPSSAATLLMLQGGAVKQTLLSRDTLAALKAVVVTNLQDGAIMQMLGYGSAGDGGGGFFVYSATSTATDNDGLVVRPASGPGRWIRSYSGPVDPRWFGAKFDGLSNDTIPLFDTLTALDGVGGIVQCPLGTALFSSTLTVPKGVTVLGMGFAQQRLNGGLGLVRPTVLKKSGNITGIILQESCGLEKITIDGAIGNLGVGVNLKGSRTHLRDVGVFEQGGIGVTVSDDANSWQLENVTSGWNASHGFYIHSATNNSNIGNAIGCLAWTNGGDGWRINSTFMSMFSGCYAEANTGYGWRVMALATVNNFIGCGGESNGTEFVFESGSINNAFTGASRNYYPTDSGENSIFHASGGESGRKGWAGFGLARMGAASAIGVSGAFSVLNGFGAHGDAAAGKAPGYYYWDLGAIANNRAWESFANQGSLQHRFMDDDGTDPKDWLTITRTGTGAGSVFDVIWGADARFYLPILPQAANNADALAKGILPGRLYRADGAGAAPVDTVLQCHA